MSAVWYITGPGGGLPVALSDADMQSLNVSFRIMAASRAELQIHRDFDATGAWWAAESIVTIYQAASPEDELIPFFTGRVQETPVSADGSGEYRTLTLADAWQDLEEIIYQEAWGVGAGTVLIPKAVLGLNASGDAISTGDQIDAAVTYAIAEGAAMQKGTIAAGVSVWPSEVVNISCADVILGELRWNPDQIAWLDHSTLPPTFRTAARASLSTHDVDVAAEEVRAFQHAKLVRSIPRGVRILYEDAAVIDDTVYRSGYLDTAGATTGRKIMHATIELAGMNMQLQKSRIETRTLPTDAASMKAYFKKKWPELKDLNEDNMAFKNVTFTLAPLEDQPDPINPKAERLEVTTVEDLPRELVRGTIEDWMRKKVGQVTIKYDLFIKGVPADPEKQKLLEHFAGVDKTFTVTATNAVTKIYKGITSFTEGESVPEGIAAAVYAAASADQYEGSVTLSYDEVPPTQWLGHEITLHNDSLELMPGMPIHGAEIDVVNGSVQLSFGPLPYLSAGDFLELQRMANRRPVTWMSKEERSSNEWGASAHPAAKGDTVSGFDYPETISPPGGGQSPHPFDVFLKANGAGGYYVTVEHGEVVERDISAGEDEDCLRYYPAVNRLQVDGTPAQFAITVGQAIFVKVTDDAYGKINPAVDVVLEVAANTTKSLTYIPGVQTGVCYYMLAELVSESGVVKLKHHASRSNIYHDSGLTADSVLRSCPYYEPEASEETPGAQLLRLSFVSGRLASVGQSIEDRPLAETHEIGEIDADPCC